MLKQFSCIDIFCGIGGLTHGFVKEGFNVVAGIDSDPSCKFAYEYNNNALFINKSIEDIHPDEINNYFTDKSHRILMGCAPCQPFSRYTQKVTYSDKWNLLRYFIGIINEIQPEIITMENIPELSKHKKYKIFSEFIDSLKLNDYHIWYAIVNCLDYGIPQHRQRLLVLASKLGEIELINKTCTPDKYKTLRSAISRMEKIKDGETSKKDRIHKSSKLSEINKKRIKNSVPGGSWRQWDNELVLECHKKDSGAHYGSVYGRMSWDEPSPTITTQFYGYGNGRFGHPEQDRAISLREGALLQTFPIEYKFLQDDSPVPIKTFGKNIGNAVPVELGRAIARSIKIHIEEIYA